MQETPVVGRPVGYVLTNFPQLSETFIENEIRALHQLGDEVLAVSLYEPIARLRGATELDPSRLAYRPSPPILAAHFLRWLLRHPFISLSRVWQALRLRSQTMLRGALSAGWIASQFERVGARHIHAHFALDAACAGRVASDLLGVPFTFTLHAHELYLRNRTLCTRLALADRLVTVCNYNVAVISTLCPQFPIESIEIIRCGVDMNEFIAPERAPHGGSLRILSVGRLVPQKGFDDLIRAIAILREGGRDVQCEIVGDGELRDELEALSRSLGVERWIRFAGPLHPQDVSRQMSQSDIFVLACKRDTNGNRDSMPVVVKEAMAVGLPVVGTNEVAMPEMIDDAVGRLAAPSDPHGLATAIEQLLDVGHGGRQRMGLAGRDRVEREFNLLTETAKLKALFDGLGH